MAKKQVKNPMAKPIDKQVGQQIEVTNENAAKLSVHFLSQIYGRLGYIIKLLEKKNG